MEREIEEATVDLMVQVANTGVRWVRSLGAQDWRGNIVSELRTRKLDLLGNQGVLTLKDRLLSQVRSATEFDPFPYFVARPQNRALSEKWVSAIGVEARLNKDQSVNLGFHVLFFGKPQSLLTAFGHRFDAPEGSKTTHNFYHVQPLRAWRNGMYIPGAFQQQPDTFPTIPLQATDSLDLALHAVHVACGSELIEGLCKTVGVNKVLKARANQMRKSTLRQ